jgi:hypothetical protein
MEEPATLVLRFGEDVTTKLVSELTVEDIQRVIVARADIPGGPYDAAYVRDGYAYLHRSRGGKMVRYRLVIE